MTNESVPDPKLSIVIVAEEGDEIIGMRVLRPLLWAGSMWVDDRHRRKGVATEIQKVVEQTIQKVGLGNEYFMFPSTNVAESTVESFGLTPLPHLTVYRGLVGTEKYYSQSMHDLADAESIRKHKYDESRDELKCL